MNATVETLYLADLNELFRAPEPDPFGGRAESESGMSRLLAAMRVRPRRAVRVKFVIPASQITPDLESRCRAAVQAYCALRIGQLKLQNASLWREGWATLARGILFLAACMIGSKIFAEPQYLPGFLGRFLDEGFIIAGWVALWYPLDVLLYQHWPVNRDRGIYESLEKMAMEFVPAGASVEDSTRRV